MTGNEMLSNLGLRLEDPAATVFTSDAKLDALNLAQATVVNMIDSGYLTELEQIVSATSTASDGTKTFAAAGIDPVRGGISGIYSVTNSAWCTMVETKDLKRLENSYLSGTTSCTNFPKQFVQ